MIVSDLIDEMEESNFTEKQFRDLVVVATNRQGEMFAVTDIDIEEATAITGIDRVVLTIASLADLGLVPPPATE